MQNIEKQRPSYTALKPEHSDAVSEDATSALKPGEDPSQFCPVCSQRLEARRCKLICSGCGYYMSCADYY